MFELIKKLNKNDYLWIIAATIIILAVNFGIIFYFIAKTPAGYFFNWRSTYSFTDTYVYYSYINQAKEGLLLFRDLFQHDSSFFIFNIFWLALGLLAKIFSLSAIATYHLSYLFITPIFLFTLYLYFVFFFGENKQAVKIGFILSVFGTGLGGFIFSFVIAAHQLFDINNLLLDNLPEGTVFFNLINSPHFIFGLFLFILAILNTLLAVEKKKLRYSVFAGLSALVFFQFRPFPAITFFAVFTAYISYLALTGDKNTKFFIKHALIVFSISSFAFLYHLIMFLKNTWWSIQGVSNVILTPNIIVCLIVFSPLLFFVFLGARALIKKEETINCADFLAFWMPINLAVAYLPVAFQRRLLEGWQISLAPFAVLGILKLMQKYNLTLKKNFLYLSAFFVLLFCSTDIVFVYYRIWAADGLRNSFFNRITLRETADWLKYNSALDDVILSSGETGNILAGSTIRRVYYGHWAETIDADKKIIEVGRFFAEMDTAERRIFLKDKNIKFVVFENAWTAEGMKEPAEDFLEKTYYNNDYIVYRVKNV